MNEQKFKLFLAQKGLRNRTIESKIDCFRQIDRHLKVLNKDNALEYILELRARGRKASYLNTIILTLRDICECFGIEDFDIPLFKLEESYKSTLSENEINQIINLKPLNQGEKTSLKWERWSLFFTIMATCGMRPSEVALLNSESCDFGRQVFILKQTKTTPRLVPMPPSIINCLLYHLKLTQNGILFPNPTNKNGVFDKDDWCYAFKVRLKMLGIQRPNLSIYSLRHSFISRMLDEDINIFKIQKIVGHKRIETTAIYTHLTTKDIQKTIRLDPLTRKDNKPEETAQLILSTLKEYHLEEDKRFIFELIEGSNELSFNLRW